MNSGQDAGAPAAPAPAAADDGPALTAADAEPAGPGRPAGAPVWTAAMAVLLALLIAGIATAAVFFLQVRHSAGIDGRRQAAIAAGRRAVTDLTTADYRHPQQYASRLRDEGTGRFLSLLGNSATGFRNVLIKGRVQTAGRVAEVGVRRLGAGSAELTVLAYVTVRNSQAPKGVQRVYRLSVSMIQAGPRWLVSRVEFVR